MDGDARGARVMVRLATGIEVDPLELADLTEPWQGPARALLAIEQPRERIEALPAMLVGRPDGEAIRRAMLATSRVVYPRTDPGIPPCWFGSPIL